jgi:hypothetical protein
LSATGTSTSTTRVDDAGEVLARMEWSMENQTRKSRNGRR